MPRDVPEGTIEVRIRIGGPAGFGIKAAGQSLARVFTRAGYETADITEYPSLIKGGHNTYHVRVSSRPIYSHVLDTDILVALDVETVGRHLDELTPGAAIIFDPKDVDIDTVEGVRSDLCPISVPMTDIVYDIEGGKKIMRNTIALGAVLGYMGFPLSYLEDSIDAMRPSGLERWPLESACIARIP
jgi:2-oxoglutarate ferredoxin oxidoreductase subunit alpha